MEDGRWRMAIARHLPSSIFHPPVRNSVRALELTATGSPFTIRRTMRYINWLGYAAIPIAFLVHFWLGREGQDHKPWEPTITFLFAALGVIPLAHLMGESTEHLSSRTGPT